MQRDYIVFWIVGRFESFEQWNTMKTYPNHFETMMFPNLHVARFYEKTTKRNS